jgi:hypothetical protein
MTAPISVLVDSTIKSISTIQFFTLCKNRKLFLEITLYKNRILSVQYNLKNKMNGFETYKISHHLLKLDFVEVVWFIVNIQIHTY